MKIPLLNGDSEPFVPGTPGPFSATEPEIGAWFEFIGHLWLRKDARMVSYGGKTSESFIHDSRKKYVPHRQGPKLGDKA